jgi:3-oxoacyl-[acyl-carrier protein] reductase
MELGLRDKVALVTASSKGIGRAVALALAGEGARVSICARGAPALEETARFIRRQTGAEVLATPADISTAAGVEQVVEATPSHFGRIDILVCNVGGPPPGTFFDFDDAAWERAFQQILMSVVRLCRRAAPDMRRRGWGRIITITSMAVKEPRPDLILSNVFRAGVTALVKSLANELAPFGILVNNVMPNAVLTDRMYELACRQAQAEGISEEEVLARWAQAIPVGRIAAPEEFAQVVLFLASERAGYLTGISVPVDGGSMRSLI